MLGRSPAPAAGEADLDLLGNASLGERVRAGVNEQPNIDKRRGGRGDRQAFGHAVPGVVHQARGYAAGGRQLGGAVGRQDLALHGQRSGKASAEPAVVWRMPSILIASCDTGNLGLALDTLDVDGQLGTQMSCFTAASTGLQVNIGH